MAALEEPRAQTSLSGTMGSVGPRGWGGWAKTHFWVDPHWQKLGILMPRHVCTGASTVITDFRDPVFQALVD